jgi:four helix bundle protein
MTSVARNQKPGVRMEKEPAKNFQDLIVWQKAHQFVLYSYYFFENFPLNVTYRTGSQFRRAALSIPTNIAEGFKKKTKPDKGRHMNISQASLEECRY